MVEDDHALALVQCYHLIQIYLTSLKIWTYITSIWKMLPYLGMTLHSQMGRPMITITEDNSLSNYHYDHDREALDENVEDYNHDHDYGYDPDPPNEDYDMDPLDENNGSDPPGEDNDYGSDPPNEDD